MITTENIRSDNLPLWMRQAQRGVDWGTVIIITFSAILAVMMMSGINMVNANENHAFMANDIAQMLREGRLYPRWSPHVLGGYGAPIPNFYPIGGAYLVAAMDMLFTNDTLIALRVMYAISIISAGGAMYAFMMRWCSSPQSILAAILYIYSPMMSHTIPQALGDLPLMMSGALLPMILWWVSRMIRINRFQDFLIIALLVFLQTMIDVGMLAVVSAIVLILALVKGRESLSGVIYALISGVGMAAFFWVPALWERDAVRWVPPVNLQEPAYLSLGQMIAPFAAPDPAAILIIPQYTLGVILVIFALIGIWTAARRLSPLWIFIVIGTALISALIIMPDQAWLMLPITFCAAVIGSEVITLRVHLPPALSRIGLTVGLIIALIGGIPAFYPLRQETPLQPPTPEAQIQYEQQGFGVPVLAATLPIPVTLGENTAPNRLLRNSYATGNLIKIPPEQIIQGASVTAVTHQTHSTLFQVNSANTLDLTYQTAYFEGWRATLDGDPLEIQPDPQTGLIRAFVLPVNNGLLEFSLGTTDVRLFGWGVSILLLINALSVTRRRYMRQSKEPFYDDLLVIAPSEARLIFIALIAFIMVAVLLRWPNLSSQFAAADYHAIDDTRVLRAQTEVGIELLSYRPPHRTYPRGGVVSVDLYWRALRFLTENYRVQVIIQDIYRSGDDIASPPRSPGGFPTRRWYENGYISDHYRLKLPDDALPGNYRIGVILYNCTTDCQPSNRLAFFSATGAQPIFWLPDVISITE